MPRSLLCLALALLGSACFTGGASAATPLSFDGSCEIAGPIEPEQPINVLPRPGARFSFTGKGSCSGTLSGTARNRLRARVEVVGAETLFDTCELGPDFGVRTMLRIRRARKRWVRFPLTLEMPRVLTVGVFLLHGPEGGRAFGQAELVPPDAAAAIRDCGDLAGGITTATLEASFRTVSPLVGT
jgi:hypothetical protein